MTDSRVTTGTPSSEEKGAKVLAATICRLNKERRTTASWNRANASGVMVVSNSKRIIAFAESSCLRLSVTCNVTDKLVQAKNSMTVCPDIGNLLFLMTCIAAVLISKPPEYG